MLGQQITSGHLERYCGMPKPVGWTLANDHEVLTPKPVQTPIPTFVATSTADTVKLAADHGDGVMAGPPFPLENVCDTLRLYREIAPQGDPKLVLIRFYHLAQTHAQAGHEAASFLQPFLERMRLP